MRLRRWSAPDKIGAFAFRRLLGSLPCGQITAVMPDGTRLHHRGPEPGPDAELLIHRWRAVRRLLAGGDIGFAESYVAGDWSSPDLAALLEFAARNAPYVERVVAGSAPLRAWNQILHTFRSNSKAGSRRNIFYHYDLGNAFYALWLDPSMSYSSGLYPSPDASLEAAQQAKIARAGDLLDLTGGETVLEIGCGWGALADHLVERGARVTGVTLSQSQLEIARQRPAARIGAAEFRLEDYRDTGGLYDRIVSIEMIEAVGERYWPAYFRTIRDRLKPGGIAVLQAITIAEDRFDAYRKSTDFIQRHIFPGGMLPTVDIIREQARRVGLEYVSGEWFADSYARTLADWRHRFHQNAEAVEKLGFDLGFRRMWDYYLSYCEGGFRSGAIDVGLYRLRG
ncbi:cyclopropane-fatty-acyl-phospholipid synthase [Aquabacter spiritensis]|uniref:Cyclopropane-fatty-acyl-phospholipid synthase n=1 Tax=Aquabacter spiritensis TaxID=933073 RepID=A0A4R3M2P6_9HYPH|nr:cyclopropane-fatty-acyl-phospholipid synthase [Aquabacter spiritensis]